MKPYLLFLLFCINISSFGQTAPEIVKPADFTIENVIFKSAGVNLAGSIFKPKLPNAAVVLVHGSGQESRMLKIAELLARNGIAVLTYDKRGVGKSDGVYAGPEVGTNNIDSCNLNLLALDASAACNVLSEHVLLNNVPLGLMGFSQAGWIIPMAAKRNKKVTFIVLFSGPVVTTLEQLRFQFYTQGSSIFWDTHTEAEAREHIKNDPDRYQFTNTDPRDILSILPIHGLWLFGGKDVQIPTGLSVERLNILKAQGKRFEYLLFPELGHNTAFSSSKDPVNFAIQWINALHNNDPLLIKR